MAKLAHSCAVSFPPLVPRARTCCTGRQMDVRSANQQVRDEEEEEGALTKSRSCGRMEIEAQESALEELERSNQAALARAAEAESRAASQEEQVKVNTR